MFRQDRQKRKKRGVIGRQADKADTGMGSGFFKQAISGFPDDGWRECGTA